MTRSSSPRAAVKTERRACGQAVECGFSGLLLQRKSRVRATACPSSAPRSRAAPGAVTPMANSIPKATPCSKSSHNCSNNNNSNNNNSYNSRAVPLTGRRRAAYSSSSSTSRSYGRSTRARTRQEVRAPSWIPRFAGVTRSRTERAVKTNPLTSPCRRLRQWASRTRGVTSRVITNSTLTRATRSTAPQRCSIRTDRRSSAGRCSCLTPSWRSARRPRAVSSIPRVSTPTQCRTDTKATSHSPGCLTQWHTNPKCATNSGQAGLRSRATPPRATAPSPSHLIQTSPGSRVHSLQGPGVDTLWGFPAHTPHGSKDLLPCAIWAPIPPGPRSFSHPSTRQGLTPWPTREGTPPRPGACPGPTCLTPPLLGTCSRPRAPIPAQTPAHPTAPRSAAETAETQVAHFFTKLYSFYHSWTCSLILCPGRVVLGARLG